MLALHCDSNVILIEPFQSRHDRHYIAVYSHIMTRPQERGHAVDLQVLDNEASAEYHHTITQTRKEKFQLLPPDVHLRNAAERAIRTFKAHFLAILAGVDRAFPCGRMVNIGVIVCKAWPRCVVSRLDGYCHAVQIGRA